LSIFEFRPLLALFSALYCQPFLRAFAELCQPLPTSDAFAAIYDGIADLSPELNNCQPHLRPCRPLSNFLLPIFKEASADHSCRPFLQAFCRPLPASADMEDKGIYFVNVCIQRYLPTFSHPTIIGLYVKVLSALSIFTNLFIADL
jgi:transcriptional regulator of met regulon